MTWRLCYRSDSTTLFAAASKPDVHSRSLRAETSRDRTNHLVSELEPNLEL